MVSHKCIGCLKTFSSNQSLASHRSKCRPYKNRHKKVANSDVSIQVLDTAQENIAGPSSMVSDSGMESTDNMQTDVNGEWEDITASAVTETTIRRDKHQKNPVIRVPKKFHDDLPPTSVQIEQQMPSDIPDAQESELERVLEPKSPNFQTKPNSFGVYRVYEFGAPSFIPDELKLNDSSPSPKNLLKSQVPRPSDIPTPVPTESPFQNRSTELLMSWFYDSSKVKSFGTLDSLVNDVILDPDFKLEECVGFSASKEARALDDFKTSHPRSVLCPDDGWIETSVPIPLPPPNRGSWVDEDAAPIYDVRGLFYRKPLEVIKAALQEKSAERFHLTPFKEYWKSSEDASPERIFSEIYNSDAFLKEHASISSQPRDGCSLEVGIIPILLSSDSTHLASFGNASLWPIYLCLGNQSKYERGKPTAFAAHHLTYIPKLDDMIQDAYRAVYNVSATADTLTHLRRDLMQAIWMLLLDDELMEAYIDGIVITFPDGISRRQFIRFFLYSADYPEKVLLACIKYLSRHPCPRCLIEKCHISHLGAKIDIKNRQQLRRVDNEDRRYDVEAARKAIFRNGIQAGSANITDILGEKSLTPTRNAFSERLLPHGFNFYTMFAPDLMHEFELGVWKMVFVHLLRILYAKGGDLIQMLNNRYRAVPTFGKDTIRKFTNNASAMKKLAARDYEDLLQCSIAVFEGLLDDEDDEIVMDLLFELSTWHALAKLRLHTESTVRELECSTTRLGTALRRFESITCARFATRDLPSEEASRGRRKASMAAKAANAADKGKRKANENENEKETNIPRQRKFNMSTYKLHALGDYPIYIRQYGTSDNYSTWMFELEHRRPKKYYPISHKGRFAVGIAKHVRRERILFNLSNQRSRKRRRLIQAGRGSRTLLFSENEAMPPASPLQHYEMSHETKYPVTLATALGDNEDDPALTGFLPQLKDHILSRILKLEYDGDNTVFTDEDRASVAIVGNCIYKHKVLRINYTTYDLQREQDSLNPRTHANIITLSLDERHPYWYCRILGIYHVVVLHPSLAEPLTLDFLHIRWYALHKYKGNSPGWRKRRLYQLGFVPHVVDEELGMSRAFGFLDPAHVIRGAHLIPGYAYGSTDSLLPRSVVSRREDEDDEDWNVYLVNFFVDRDMVMRYRGGGVGHKSMREATDFFLNDRHELDLRARTSAADETEESNDGWEDVLLSTPSESDRDDLEGGESNSSEGIESDENRESSDGESDDVLGPEEGMVSDELDLVGLAPQ